MVVVMEAVDEMVCWEMKGLTPSQLRRLHNQPPLGLFPDALKIQSQERDIHLDSGFCLPILSFTV